MRFRLGSSGGMEDPDRLVVSDLLLIVLLLDWKYLTNYLFLRHLTVERSLRQSPHTVRQKDQVRLRSSSQLGAWIRSESQSRQGSRSVHLGRDANLSPAFCIGWGRYEGARRVGPAPGRRR